MKFKSFEKLEKHVPLIKIAISQQNNLFEPGNHIVAKHS
jgi:hypothetical protein